MTVPVMVVRALAIDAVPFFASVVTSSLNPFAVFFPALIAAVVSWSKASMRCCWNVSCLRASASCAERSLYVWLFGSSWLACNAFSTPSSTLPVVVLT